MLEGVMPSETVGSFGTGQMPDDLDWILRCYELGLQYVRFIVGEPPPEVTIGIIWNEYERGDYPSIGVSWTFARPDEYISKCDRVLEIFGGAVDWYAISPNSVLPLIDDSDDEDLDDEAEADAEDASDLEAPRPGFHLIETPGPFAAKAEWRAFLRQMEGLPQDDLMVMRAVKEARDALADKDRPEK
jgi:hypothetical protein